jgi:hypothetical protein
MEDKNYGLDMGMDEWEEEARVRKQKWENGRKELRVKDMISEWEIKIGGWRQ